MLFVKCRLKMMPTHTTAYDLGFAFINRKINNCCISQNYISYTHSKLDFVHTIYMSSFHFVHIIVNVLHFVSNKNL